MDFFPFHRMLANMPAVVLGLVCLLAGKLKINLHVNFVKKNSIFLYTTNQFIIID